MRWKMLKSHILLMIMCEDFGRTRGVTDLSVNIAWWGLFFFFTLRKVHMFQANKLNSCILNTPPPKKKAFGGNWKWNNGQRLDLLVSLFHFWQEWVSWSDIVKVQHTTLMLRERLCICREGEVWSAIIWILVLPKIY